LIAKGENILVGLPKPIVDLRLLKLLTNRQPLHRVLFYQSWLANFKSLERDLGNQLFMNSYEISVICFEVSGFQN
jgi:hypothetical protein